MLLTRRSLLITATAIAGCARSGLGPRRTDPLIDEVERRTFAFFREVFDTRTGLMPDRWPSPGPCSIAALGFALTAWPIGVERGWMTRTEARARTLRTLRFLHDAPQGPGASGVSGHRGFFYHFLDMNTGLRFRNSELSTVDTALLFGGVMFAAGWFDAASAEEAELRRLADRIVNRADWPWMQRRGAAISMGWRPESGFIADDWEGYNEGMLVYLLALGSEGRPIGDDGWRAWTRTYPDSWRGGGAGRHLAFAPHFGHQYSHVWVDFRGIRDEATRQAGFDYFENSRRATLAQRAYAAANPMGWRGYSADLWGLTACDGPGDLVLEVEGRGRTFRGYSARGPEGYPDGFDDGTIAPTAAIASVAFAPEIVLSAARALTTAQGGRLFGRYGFVDAFNPTLRAGQSELPTGTVDPEHGWVARDLLGIDQGPILAMIANDRDDVVWRVTRRSPVIRRGLMRAGFEGGWLSRKGPAAAE